MFGKGKKAYDAPAIAKFALGDDDVEKIVGGIQKRKEIGTETDNSGNNPGLNGTDSTTQTGDSAFNPGNVDVGQGRGRGGGCDGVPYHRNARTFSSGRNSGC